MKASINPIVTTPRPKRAGSQNAIDIEKISTGNCGKAGFTYANSQPMMVPTM